MRRVKGAEAYQNGICIELDRGQYIFATEKEVKFISYKEVKKCQRSKNFNTKGVIIQIAWILSYIILYVLLVNLNFNFLNMFRIYLAVTIPLNFFKYYLECSIVLGESVLRYHGAEHMVFNACQSLKKVPTLSEIKKFSRFHNSCGTNSTTIFLGIEIAIFLSTFLMHIVLSIAMIASSIGMLVCANKLGYLNLLQTISTKEPTDKELTVAIKALKFLQENQ